jgi:hypothetical protein
VLAARAAIGYEKPLSVVTLRRLLMCLACSGTRAAQAKKPTTSHPSKKASPLAATSMVNTFAAEQYERFNSNAIELTKISVDVLVAVTRPAALATSKRRGRSPRP